METVLMIFGYVLLATVVLLGIGGLIGIWWGAYKLLMAMLGK